MNHLTGQEAALAADGDLPMLEQMRSRAHCLVCAKCRTRVAQFKQDGVRVRAIVPDFELPRAIKWTELENEMFANIRLGMDVSAIRHDFGREVDAIGNEESQPRLGWRASIAIGAVCATVMTGWFLAGPRGNPYMQMAQPEAAIAQVRSGELLLKGDQAGVGVESRGSGLILRSSASQPSRVEVGLEGSVRRSAVDNESGQITVSQIYVE